MVKEVVELIKEHRPVEREFVVRASWVWCGCWLAVSGARQGAPLRGLW